MNRLFLFALVLLAVGCSGQPPAAVPSTTAALPNPPPTSSFAAELVSAEVRPVKLRKPNDSGSMYGSAALIVRVRFTNSDGTIDTTGWTVTASAKDNFGNTVGAVEPTALPLLDEHIEPSGGQQELVPGKPAARTFLFNKPIATATDVNIEFVPTFPRRKSASPAATVNAHLKPSK